MKRSPRRCSRLFPFAQSTRGSCCLLIALGIMLLSHTQPQGFVQAMESSVPEPSGIEDAEKSSSGFFSGLMSSIVQRGKSVLGSLYEKGKSALIPEELEKDARVRGLEDSESLLLSLSRDVKDFMNYENSSGAEHAPIIARYLAATNALQDEISSLITTIRTQGIDSVPLSTVERLREEIISLTDQWNKDVLLAEGALPDPSEHEPTDPPDVVLGDLTLIKLLERSEGVVPEHPAVHPNDSQAGAAKKTVETADETTSNTPSSSHNKKRKRKKESKRVGRILGIAIGVLCACALVLTLVFLGLRKRISNQRNGHPRDGHHHHVFPLQDGTDLPDIGYATRTELDR